MAKKKTKVTKSGQERVSKKIGHLIGKEEKDLCLGCITEKYPLQIDGEKQRGQATLEEFRA